MPTNQKSDNQHFASRLFTSGNFAISMSNPETRKRGLLIVLAGFFCIIVFVAFKAMSGHVGNSEFELGKVADRDVIAEKDITYIDTKSTKIRTDAELRLVPAIFSVDKDVNDMALAALADFKQKFVKFMAKPLTNDEAKLKLQSSFPDLVSANFLEQLMDYPAPATAIEQGRIILVEIMRRGIFAFPDKGLEAYNLETVELRRDGSDALAYEQISIEKAITRNRIKSTALSISKTLKLSATLTVLATEIATAFAKENAFFDAEQSQRRIENIKSHIEPVTKKISRGDKIIREGFLVTADDLERFAAINNQDLPINTYYILSGVLVFCIFSLSAFFMLGFLSTGVHLKQESFWFVLGVAVSYFLLANVLYAFLPSGAYSYFEAFLPTALVSMLVAILIGERFAFPFTVFLALLLILVVGFDAFISTEAIISGLAGIVLVRRAEKRIDLVRAGGQLAIILFICSFALAALSGKDLTMAMTNGLWSSVNGFLCAVLTLAFLPVLEYSLNVPTVFRLQELSDLNAPALKRLLSVAPGTYSHSVAVAHLAESACRAIGANALLARVGAYYHDIGKIEKPEYFIENQSGYNKHDEINPRLSATVLRGHVKFGLERADSLRLPSQVKDIIAEHHGTSLISYFFAQAQKEAEDTSSEEFRYPGPLPSSKESAVVMLADCVEAASRTVKRPTMAKLEQFVKTMVMSKYESAQLAMSSLTFRDLELIKNSFVRVLSGHFHSRIEYPKTKEPM